MTYKHPSQRSRAQQSTSPRERAEGCPPALVHLSVAQLLRSLWGDALTLSSSELEWGEVTSVDQLLKRFGRARWISLPHVDLCSFTVRGAAGDEAVYKYASLKRLIPRTYLVPWDRDAARFDHAQAITGLTKIAGMQDEGVHQVIDIEDVNARCEGGEVVSMEKANGKACVFWVKRLGGQWTLGFGSKTSLDPEYCYDVSALMRGERPWRSWSEARLREITDAPPLEISQREIIRGVAERTLRRMSLMSESQIVQFIQYLTSGVTLCGELEEGGRHIVPTSSRVVYFAASRLTDVGVTLDSPLDTAAILARLGFQSTDELASTRESFTALNAQPSSLQLSSSRREGSVRYFLDPRGAVVATMKIKDPHYMFYRKLRNAMHSSATTVNEVLHRLVKSSRDPYYQRCLRAAQIPRDFSATMLRSAARFLWWFTQQPDLGDRFRLAGFTAEDIGLGALMTRWREAEGETRLGDYEHVISAPELYDVPSTWLTPTGGGERVAMLALRGAQGSGKTTLSIALCISYNQRSAARAANTQEKVGVTPLALPAEQDPLQKKRAYLLWLERGVWPLVREWLIHHSVPLDGDLLPDAVTQPLEWRRIGTGKPSTRFPKLLTGLSQSYRAMIDSVASSERLSEQSADEERAGAEAEVPPLVIVNARCNQSAEATRRWEDWLEARSAVGLATARLNAPLALLSERIKARGRDGDDQLLGEVVRLTRDQVAMGEPADVELDATRPLDELTESGLAAIELALERVRPQWSLTIE